MQRNKLNRPPGCGPGTDKGPEIPGNAAQRRAISHRDGPLRVLAGPGSGKTFVIVQRLKYLIEHCGIDPATILTITFTRAAAEEMKRRFDRLTEHRYPETAFGTFHSIFYHILKQSGHPAETAPAIITETEKQKIIKMILTDLHDRHHEIVCSADLSSVWLSEIARLKGEGTDLSAGTAFAVSDIPYREYFPEAFREYLRTCRELSKLDFEDMIGECLHLFREKPEVLETWRKRFMYIQIDEYQDINRMQSDVVRLLAAPANNLFIVGDDDQSIYGFRGSRPDIMLAFDQMYPGAGQVLLNINYRCRRKILEASTRVIRENRVRFDKETYPGRDDEEGKVRLLAFESRDDEIRAIREELSQRNLTQEKSFCIIVRTNSQAQRIAKALAGEGAEAAGREPVNPYATAEVQDILSYLRLSQNPLSGREDLLRILNKPVRYLSRESVRDGRAPFAEMRAYYADRPRVLTVIDALERDLKLIAGMKPGLAIRYIRTVIGYDAYVRIVGSAEGEQEKNSVIKRLDDLQQEAAAFTRTDLFLKHVQGKADAPVPQRKKRTVTDTETGIPVITMHAAKGLEFDTVWIPSVNEGILPSRRSISPEQIEEERRLFYVAMTRARSRLFISYLTGDENYSYVPSRFLRPLKKELRKE